MLANQLAGLGILVPGSHVVRQHLLGLVLIATELAGPIRLFFNMGVKHVGSQTSHTVERFATLLTGETRWFVAVRGLHVQH